MIFQGTAAQRLIPVFTGAVDWENSLGLETSCRFLLIQKSYMDRAQKRLSMCAYGKDYIPICH